MIAIYRSEVKPFTDKQIELLCRISPARPSSPSRIPACSTNCAKRFPRQTATADVLKVISSSPGELAPVFETMLSNATRICDAQFGNLHLYQNGAFLTVAQHGAPPAYAELRRRDPMTALNRGR